MPNKLRRRLILALFCLALLAALAGLRFVSFNNNIELMLPRDTDVRRSMNFLKESELANTVVISLALESSSAGVDDLIRTADSLSGSLHPPLVTEVIAGIPEETDTVSEMMEFLRYAPQLLDRQKLDAVADRINPEGVQESLHRHYHTLLTPAGAFLAPFIRRDPLGTRLSLIDDLQKMSHSFGYQVQVVDGHFISADERHALLVLKTPVEITDGFGSRRLVNYLRERVQALPDYVSADIVSGHTRTVSNEDVMKRDVWMISIFALAIFSLLYAFVYRNPQALYIYLLPFFSVIIAINVVQLIFNELPYFIVGMGALLAGISADYGIHVYTAVRRSGKTVTGSLRRPMLTCMLTTAAVFVAFFFSNIRGYHYLAVFALTSIAFSFMVALFVLPHCLKFRTNASFAVPQINAGFKCRPWQARLSVGCWLTVLLTAGVFASRVQLDSDINRLDGTRPDIIRAEQQFHETWGAGQAKQAILVVEANTREAALEENEQVYHEAVSVMDRDNFISMARVWPSLKTRRENALHWQAFWSENRAAELKELIHEYAPRYGFSAQAFLPFFEHLYETTDWEENPDSKIFQELTARFIQKGRNGYQVLSFFPDDEAYVSQIRRIDEQRPDTFLISQNNISRQLARAFSADILPLFVIAGLLIVGITILSLRNLKLSLLASIPEVTAILVSLAALSLLGLSLNAPSIMAIIVLVGLTNSYGVFMTFYYHHKLTTDTPRALFIAALTTIVGSGALLFARHPVLFSIGVTLFAGLVSGYLVSQLVVPVLHGLWFPKRGCETS